MQEVNDWGHNYDSPYEQQYSLSSPVNNLGHKSGRVLGEVETENGHVNKYQIDRNAPWSQENGEPRH